MIEIDRYIKFLKVNKLNQAQFILLYLLYLKREDLLIEYKGMFPTEDDSAIGKHGLADLINRGFIVDVNPKEEGMKAFKLTEKFTHIFIDKFTAGEQLWEAYPSFIVKGGIRYPLTLTSEDEIREAYAKKIKGMREEHEEVMKDLEYAKENNLIQGTIKNFVASRQWTAFREERKGLKSEETLKRGRETTDE